MSSTSSPSGTNKKKSMKDLQEEITNLYNNIRLFEKGTKFFSGKSSATYTWAYVYVSTVCIYDCSDNNSLKILTIFCFSSLEVCLKNALILHLKRCMNPVCISELTSVWHYFADETKVLIAKHVLKTVCTDITNILVNFLAADLMMSVENPGTITNEVSRNSWSQYPLSSLYWLNDYSSRT